MGNSHSRNRRYREGGLDGVPRNARFTTDQGLTENQGNINVAQQLPSKKKGWVILKAGEKGVLYNHEGSASEVNGPQRIFLWRQKFVKLLKQTADQTEYLVIKHRDGSITHRPGPCAVYLNPVRHDSIRKRKCVQLTASEAIVVYRECRTTATVDRRVVSGPIQFIPAENEWLHAFKWHGVDPDNKTQFLPGQRETPILEIIPTQFYYNVGGIRTADEGLLRVKLMVFYSLNDIELMLSTTEDPIADIINCICSDLVTFAASRTYLEFANESSKLNDVSTYARLLQRVKAIGFEVSKVVFRGYFVAPAIQLMHDKGTEKRSRLKFDFEKEEQVQKFKDQELRAEHQRLLLEHKAAVQQLKHTQSLNRATTEHMLRLKESEVLEKLNLEKETKLNAVKALRVEHSQKVAEYKELDGLGVNLTEYILSENPRPDKVMEIVSASNNPVVHFHHTDIPAAQA